MLLYLDLTNKVNVTIYYFKELLKLHSNIVTLKYKNKNNAFKAEVKFTKLKMKIIQSHYS